MKVVDRLWTAGRFISRGRRSRFSATPTPSRAPAYYLHLGIYAYRRDFLLQFASWQPTPLELTEKLEQLRALEHGGSIDVLTVDRATHGIDTPEQYAAFVKRMKECSSGRSAEQRIAV